MSMSVISFLTAPRSFFNSQADSPPRLAPILILSLTGAITLGAQLLLVSMSVIGRQPTIEYVTHAIQIQLPAISVFGAAVSFGHVFGYWIVYSAVFYLVSMAFSNEGNFRDVFWLSGWGFLPWVLSGILWLSAMIISAQAIGAPVISSENPVFVQLVQQTTLVQATQYIDHLAVVWSLGLWAILLKQVRGLNNLQAIIAVAPVAVFELLKVIFIF
jgi:hypothetical protein